MLWLLFRFATSAPAWVFYKWWMWVWVWIWMWWYYVLWVYSKMRRAFRQGKKRALPSGVFRLRSAPVPPKSRRDFPPAPLTLAVGASVVRSLSTRDRLDFKLPPAGRKAPGGKTGHPVCCFRLPFGKPSRETEAVALFGMSLIQLPSAG
jgi:hypothetical protein